MPRRLVVAGIVITGLGLAMLAYLDPVIRVLLFGQTGLVGSATTFTRTGSFTGSFTGSAGSLTGRGEAGTTSLVSVVTIIVFVATVIGLLLTIAGSFAAGKGMPPGAGPAPAASDAAQDS